MDGEERKIAILIAAFDQEREHTAQAAALRQLIKGLGGKVDAATGVAGHRAEALADYSRVKSDVCGGEEASMPRHMYFDERGLRAFDEPEPWPPLSPKMLGGWILLKCGTEVIDTVENLDARGAAVFRARRSEPLLDNGNVSG